MEQIFKHFFAMGGYAIYVWPAYAIAAGVIISNLWIGISKRKRVLKQLRRARQLELGRG